MKFKIYHKLKKRQLETKFWCKSDLKEQGKN